MSTMTFGPPVFIDGPLPVAPPHSLLNVPGVRINGAGDERWMNGASLWAYPTDEPSSWDPCYSGTYREKAEGDENPTSTFGSFVGYLPITCSSITVGDDFDRFRDRAEVALDAVLSFAVERALSQGVTLSSNPSLDDANVQILAGGAALSADNALRYLEDAIGATGRMGMLHATPAVASAWFDEQWDRTNLITSMGTPVAAGGGYAGAQPVGGGAPAAGQAWAFATGPVEVRVAPFELIEIDQVLDREINLITYRAERYYLVTWDTVLQAAALVDWTP